MTGLRLAGLLPLCLVLLAALLLGGCSSTVRIGGDPPASADQPACRSLLDAMPATLADQPRRDTERADGWGTAYGDPAIVVRCGVPTPETYDETAVCTHVNGVDWFIPLDQLEDGDAEAYTMTTVNRTPRVEVVLPAAHFPPATAMADLAAPVNAHLEPSGAGCD